ncbi:hypothetical protein ACOME3_009933 [Neoechinorhynchus agilis]
MSEPVRSAGKLTNQLKITDFIRNPVQSNEYKLVIVLKTDDCIRDMIVPNNPIEKRYSLIGLSLIINSCATFDKPYSIPAATAKPFPKTGSNVLDPNKKNHGQSIQKA